MQMSFYFANISEVTKAESKFFIQFFKENSTDNSLSKIGLRNKLRDENSKDVEVHWFGEEIAEENLNIYSFCLLQNTKSKFKKISYLVSREVKNNINKSKEETAKMLIQHIECSSNELLYLIIPSSTLSFYSSLDIRNVIEIKEGEYEIPFPFPGDEDRDRSSNDEEKVKLSCLLYLPFRLKELRNIFQNKFLNENDFKEIISMENRENYRCISQPKIDQEMMKNAEKNSDKKIKIWQRGTIIYYGIDEESFPNKRILIKAVIGMERAIKKWNKINFGVKFEFTMEKFKINFYLKFRNSIVNSLSSDFAESFFPTSEISILYLHSNLFSIDNVEFIDNILVHEIGHILGLKHKFSYEKFKKNYQGEIQFRMGNGKKLAKSVMSLHFPPKIQNNDKDIIRHLYQLNEGDLFLGYEVNFVHF